MYKRQVQYGLINLGGDIAIVGNKPDGIAWKVGITDPRGTKTEIASIDIYSGGLATSGDYKRYFIYEGKRYSHILNPKTGFPCAGLRAVSVAANLCTVAGSIATIAMLKDEPEAIKWLNDLGVPFVAMDSNLRMLRNSDKLSYGVEIILRLKTLITISCLCFGNETLASMVYWSKIWSTLQGMRMVEVNSMLSRLKEFSGRIESLRGYL